MQLPLQLSVTSVHPSKVVAYAIVPLETCFASNALPLPILTIVYSTTTSACKLVPLAPTLTVLPVLPVLLIAKFVTLLDVSNAVSTFLYITSPASIPALLLLSTMPLTAYQYLSSAQLTVPTVLSTMSAQPVMPTSCSSITHATPPAPLATDPILQAHIATPGPLPQKPATSPSPF